MQDLGADKIKEALDGFNDAIDEANLDNQVGLTIKVWAGVILKTPVKLGRARASWNISEGSANETYKKSKTKRYPVPPMPPIPRVLYSKIYISNSLPCILALEDGHSQKQAPNGMLALTIEEVLNGI